MTYTAAGCIQTAYVKVDPISKFTSFVWLFFSGFMHPSSTTNWYQFVYSRWPTKSHFAYFRPKSGISPTLKNNMKGSNQSGANQKPITSHAMSGIIP